MPQMFSSAALLVTLLFSVSLAAAEKPDSGTASKASVGGKYFRLLAVLEVPGDAASHGEFNDYGYWSGTAYAGYQDLPSGYWVYVAPNWHIWGETSSSEESIEPDRPERETPPQTPKHGSSHGGRGPYAIFLNQEIIVVFTNGTAKGGRLIECGPEHLLLQQAKPAAKLIVPTAHIAYAQGDQ